MSGFSLPTLHASPVWHPYTANPHQGPRRLLTRASGAFVYDSDDNALFDATSSWWCNIHGHCHPDLVSALHRQAQRLDQILFAPHAHPVALELAAGLVTRLGEPFRKVFFSDDGSTAVEAALKMALQYWFNRGQSRNEFLSLELGYHGDTLGAVSVGHLDEFHTSFSPLLNTHKSRAPYCYRCPLGLRYPSCGIACLDRAKQHIERNGSRIAALIVEPLVLGAGGLIPYPHAYLEELMVLCRRQGILIIFDEVFTGFGRTGTFFAMDQLTTRPDIVCLSKGLTSGMLPLGATATTDEIFAEFEGGESRKFFHGHTFSANALSCAVALESLKIFDRESVLERNQALITQMGKESLRFAELKHVGDVRQLGMIWVAELVEDRRTKRTYSPTNSAGWQVATAAWEEGIWIRPMGQALYVIPPYCATSENLRHCFDVMYSLIDGLP